MDARCENCYHCLYDNKWGEYKCKLKLRTCTDSELIMGCSDYKPPNYKPGDPKPEYVVRSGATFTPHISKDGVLSWTNDKDLPNPKPINIKPRDGNDGYTPQKGVDYFTPEEVQKVFEYCWHMLQDSVRGAKIGWVTLLASAWTGEDNLYSQVVDVEGVTENSQVDLTPDIQQLAVFYNKDISFVTENDGGIVTVYAIGQKPTNDYIIQVTITEVEA